MNNANEKYIKDFDSWNRKKKIIEGRNLPEDFFFLEGEIWWVALGVNIGHEINGKNDLFERPVVILKKINNGLLWVLPLTSTIKLAEEFLSVKHHDRLQTVLISQIRTISHKRLVRFVSRLREDEFILIKDKIQKMISSIKTIPSN